MRAMTKHQQPDLFVADRQADLFTAEPVRPRDYRPDPERVRAKLQTILAQPWGADSLPWTRAKAKYYRTVFPQMSLWLPDDEAEQLRFAFVRELDRLEAGQ